MHRLRVGDQRGNAGPAPAQRGGAPRASGFISQLGGESASSPRDGNAPRPPAPGPPAPGLPVRFHLLPWTLSFCISVPLTLALRTRLANALASAALAALPTAVHTTPAAIFAALALLNGASRLTIGDHGCATLNAFVSIFTAVGNLLHLHPGTRFVAVTPFGAAVLPLRYVVWAHSTPAILLFMAAVCGVRKPGRLTLALNVAMFLSGLAGLLVPSKALCALLLAVSTLCFAIVMLAVWRWFGAAIAAAPPGTSLRRTLYFFRWHTLLSWSSFPCIVLFQVAYPHALFEAELAYALSDFNAKAVYLTLLLQGNGLVTDVSRAASRLYLEQVAHAEVMSRLRTLRDSLHAAKSTESDMRMQLSTIVGLADSLLIGTGGAGMMPPPSPRVSLGGAVSASPQLPPRCRRTSTASLEGTLSPARLSSARLSSTESSRALAAIIGAGRRVLGALDSLVQSAEAADESVQPQSTRMTLAPEPIDVAEVVAEVMAVHEGLQLRGVRLVNKVPLDLPAPIVDRTAFEHTLHCLLLAAARDTVAGQIVLTAEVGCTAGVAPAGPQQRSLDDDLADDCGGAVEPQHDAILVHLTNTGGGALSLAVLGEPASLTDPPPLAMALSAAAAVLRAMDGRVEVVDAPGEGTRVTLTLPLCAPSPPIRPASPGPRSRLRARRESMFAGASCGEETALTPRTSGAFPPVRLDDAGQEDCAAAAHAGADDCAAAEAPPPPLVLLVGSLASRSASLLPAHLATITAQTVSHALVLLSETGGALPDCALLDAEAGPEALRLLQDACSDALLLPILVLLSADAPDGTAEPWMAHGASDVLQFPLSHDRLTCALIMQQRAREHALDASASAALLRRMLPERVISRLKDGQGLIAESFPEVTILFTDVVSFTTLATEVPITDVMLMLNELFSAFDVLVLKHGAFKVETIGDCFMVCTGNDGAPNAARRMLELATDMLHVATKVQMPRASADALVALPHLALAGRRQRGHVQMRVGIHSGPAFAGVIGSLMPRFSFFGDTINCASRMESTGFPMAIQLSEATYALAVAQGVPPSSFAPCGERSIKGKGMMHTHLLREGAWEDALAAEARRVGAEKGSPVRLRRSSVAVTSTHTHE